MHTDVTALKQVMNCQKHQHLLHFQDENCMMLVNYPQLGPFLNPFLVY